MLEQPAIWPQSIRGINELAPKQKTAIYQTLIPDWIYPRFGIDPDTLTINDENVLQLRCPEGSRAMEMSLYHTPLPHTTDPCLYANLADSFLGQLMVLLIVMNDPESERFNIDVTSSGKATNLGTSSRNIDEEIRAMEAGLAPGQIRHGLRGFRNSVPVFEKFVERMNHDLFLIEPLSYHNAIIFERYGFGYTVGKSEIESINREFQQGGSLHRKLDGSTPFRKEDAWRTVRGRSWAIHDGILGHSFTGFHMYKRIYRDAGVNTFPDAVW